VLTFSKPAFHLVFDSFRRETIKSRKTPIQSFVLDMNHLSNYWDCNSDGKPRDYHHTPPINLFYGLREALAQLANEKLENVWTRHADATARLYGGLDAMGLTYFVENAKDRLPTVTTINVPAEIADWRIVTQYAMDKYVTQANAFPLPPLGILSGGSYQLISRALELELSSVKLLSDWRLCVYF